MNPETRLIVKDGEFFVRLFGPNEGRGVKSINFLWLRQRGLSNIEVNRFVEMGVLEIDKEVEPVVDKIITAPKPISMVAPIPIPPEIAQIRRGRGRPKK